MNAGTALRISKIGLGTHLFASRDWAASERDAVTGARHIVRRALELGVTLFDTAEIYGFQPRGLARRALLAGVALSDTARIDGFGTGERVLGQALGERRDEAVIATKFYPTLPVRRAVEQRAVASANRLRTGRLDLYQVHQPGSRRPGPEVMRGIAALQQAGVVGEVGISNGSLAHWRAADRALGAPVLSNQVRYSLADRAADHEILPFAQARRRVVIAYRPLELGLLSGRYHPAGGRASGGAGGPAPARMATPLFCPPNLARLGPLVALLREIAAAHAATPAQVALAWVIARPAVAAIPGASTVEQLESNVAAAEIDLADDEYAALAAASARFRPVPGPGFVSRRVRAGLGR